MLSGGSSRSWSVTWLAKIVTVHGSPNVKSESGFSVKLIGPPPTVAVCEPLLVQEIWNQAAVTFTGSSKSIVMFEPSGTWDSVAAGEVWKISGAKSPPEQTLKGVEVVRGLGAPETKLPPLESVSLQPR